MRCLEFTGPGINQSISEWIKLTEIISKQKSIKSIIKIIDN